MTDRSCIVFACAHMTDERLFAHARRALEVRHDCRTIVWRDQASMAAMAEHLLAQAPERFTLVGLSLGGYGAFEVIRRAPQRLRRLALIDTTALADHTARRLGRLKDIETVLRGGVEALIPELASRWMLPAHAADPALAGLLADMARSVGGAGQFHQQVAMLGRPDSHADLSRLRVPTLVMCGRQDPVTPVADHEAMAACVPGARLVVVEDCGHLSTIEQPEATTAALTGWLDDTEV